MEEEILKLENYALSFFTPQGEVEAVRGINLSVKMGKYSALWENQAVENLFCAAVL